MLLLVSEMFLLFALQEEKNRKKIVINFSSTMSKAKPKYSHSVSTLYLKSHTIEGIIWKEKKLRKKSKEWNLKTKHNNRRANWFSHLFYLFTVIFVFLFFFRSFCFLTSSLHAKKIVKKNERKNSELCFFCY